MDVLCSVSDIWFRASSDSILCIQIRFKVILIINHIKLDSSLTSLKLHYIELIAYYLKYCRCVTYLLTVSTSILWEVKIFNPFSNTHILFTLVVMNWHDFISYSIVFTYVNFCLGFPTLAYMFRCRLFTLLLEHNIMVLIF